MIQPPLLLTLLDDPAYRAYMKKVPSLPRNLRHGNPWQVWAVTEKGKWKGGQFSTYADAWRVAVKALRTPSILDVSLISRRKLFTPPASLVIEELTRFHPWCPRCRRPTNFEPYTSHHAVKVLTTDDPYRCYFCGIRRIMSQ